jgi:rod shape-determining protein MreD
MNKPSIVRRHSEATARTYILLPVSPLWVYSTIAVAYVLNISRFSAPVWAPDFLAVTLAFWSIREKRITGLLLPFLLGLLMDVFDSAVLGQHALSYTFLCYFANLLERRIPWFSSPGQALHLLPIFLLTQGIVLFVSIWMGGEFPGWLWFTQSLTNALLWPIASYLLLIPQRRTQNRADTPI